MKLAVYGTLRNGDKNTGRVKNTSLVYPGHQKFPAMIQDYKGKGTDSIEKFCTLSSSLIIVPTKSSII